MARTIADQLRNMGFKPDQIAGCLVDGKPLAEADQPQPSKLPRGMNKWEAAYAAELEWSLRAGDVASFAFESLKFRLAKRGWYTPDFLVVFPGGRMRFVEIKGFLRDDAALKFKVAREQYPQFEWLMLRKVRGGGWESINI